MAVGIHVFASVPSCLCSSWRSAHTASLALM